MNGLMGMGLLGWIVSFVIGFVVGGIFFLSMKLQVDYVVEKRGPTWVLPVALYARLAFVAVVLILVAACLPREKVAGALLAGLAGALLARVLVSRQIKRSATETEKEETKERNDGNGD